ncbi:peptidylprolyl isomerase [uncultured Faecalicoccus sp.]|uniref:peptidylprolyl isomerase n=1 Tax=uncultured Faecalicoccus sp. TaxID=1971760 RepID=UPI0025E045DD|nr:peptidylprolyl isomerase [uncultured Faecalicoccus sp.]
MNEFLRNNWFVVVIAVIIIAFVSYFVYDETKYNVSKASEDGQEVLASIDEKAITAKDLYDSSAPFDSSLIYNMYRNQVVEQSIEATDDMKEDAKELEDAINANSSSTADYETSIAQELAMYGYKGYNQLYDYCLMTVKEAQLQRDYIEEHFEDCIEPLKEKNPRTISLISMSVTDPDSLTEDEQKKKDNIDKALESESFADAATAYSEDTSTASNEGFYGYLDSGALSSSSSASLDATVIQAALDLEKGETSDWITVTDPNTGLTNLYRVHVDETDIQSIWDSKNETVSNSILSAVLNADSTLSYRIIEDYAKDLDIEFKDEDTQKKLEDYLAQQLGDDSDESE